MSTRRKLYTRLALGVLVVLVLLGLGFTGWALTGPGPEPAAVAALQSDAAVTVSSDRWLVFMPAEAAASGVAPATGLIFYPGGRVAAGAYAAAAHAIAAEGYLVVIVPMPLRLAVFGSGAAADVMAAYPQVRHWAVGGHSLGGAMAADFADKHATTVEGLVLWAAYPPSSDDLSGEALKVVSVYGTRDGLAGPEKIAPYRALLPVDTTYVAIEGGNHAGFGRYGPQAGDNAATITPEAQQAQVVVATVGLLAELE
jgi:hypothetical protein